MADTRRNLDYFLNASTGVFKDADDIVAQQLRDWCLTMQKASYPRSNSSTAITAASGDHILHDLSAAAGDITVTLPASPAAGDTVRNTIITDDITPSGAGTPKKLIWLLNGSNLMGGTDDDPYWLFKEGESLEMTYVGGDCGWMISDDKRIPMVCEIYDAVPPSSLSTQALIPCDTVLRDPFEMALVSTNRIRIWRDNTYSISCIICAPGVNGTDSRLVVRARISGISGGATYTKYTPQWSPAGNLNNAMTVLQRKEYDLVAGDYVQLYGASDTTVNLSSYTAATQWPELVVKEHLGTW